MVLLDGCDVGRVPIKQVRTAIRLVAQDALLLNGTLLENLFTFQTPNGLDVEAAAWKELQSIGMRSRVERWP